MDHASPHADKSTEIMPDEHILALSWSIATQPNLYRELAPNPYTPGALRIISEKFSDAKADDVARAVMLAEPEGTYDWNFRQLSPTQQEEELVNQSIIFAEAQERLVQYCETYAVEFSHQPKEFVYACLSLSVFETADVKEIERIYAQNQRRDLRVSIVNYIENAPRSTPISTEVFGKKRGSGRPLVHLAFITLSLILLLLFAQGQTRNTSQLAQAKTQILGIQSQKTTQGFLPVRLTIPAINVDAVIQQVGVTPEGEMEVPTNTSDVAWFKPGPRPGERGSAVIAGHFDGENNDTGVFTNLHKLKEGDKVYVENDIGISVAFVVRESRLYDPGYADDVFGRNDGTHLNLITCDGVWDEATKSYSKRLVVFADALF